jgi:hypothetical protein
MHQYYQFLHSTESFFSPNPLIRIISNSPCGVSRINSSSASIVEVAFSSRMILMISGQKSFDSSLSFNSTIRSFKFFNDMMLLIVKQQDVHLFDAIKKVLHTS